MVAYINMVTCLAVATSALPQFADYEDPVRRSPPRTQTVRGAAPPRGVANSRDTRPTVAPGLRETTTHVAILKQINEHNEDGSYTYGYEAADGTFKLETRFVDGRVQGKYGYIDVNGEVKIIEYGADAMGFQPTGDLPEGIIIPPPVEGNCTDGNGNDCSYDYDYMESPEEEARREIVNRARTSISDQSRSRDSPTQQRGQLVAQPITPAPLPRRPAPLAQAPRSRPVPQTPAFRPLVPQQQPILPTPPPRQTGRGSGSRGRQSPRLREQTRSQPNRDSQPVRQLNAQQTGNLPSRPSSGGFSNFPARSSPGRPAPVQSRPAPPRPPPPQDRPRQTALPPATFQTSFSPASIQPAFAARPALTFQDFTSQPSRSPPANLPKSALEVVDFNQLLKEFQNQSQSGRFGQTSRSPGPARSFGAFPSQPAVPGSRGQGLGVFQSANFPVRF